MLDRLSFAIACLGLSAALSAEPTPDSPAFWLANAQNSASQISDPAERAGVLTTIAFDFAQSGDSTSANAAADQAADAAGKITNPQGRFAAYLGLCGFNDDSGRTKQRDDALAAAQAADLLIEPSAARQSADSQLAQLHNLLVGWPAAAKSIEGIADPAQRVSSLMALADSYAQEGDSHREDFQAAIAQANADAQSVKDSLQKGMLQALIVQTQARDGDLVGAAQTAKTIVDPSAQGAAQSALADAFARAGRPNDAQTAIIAMVIAAGGSPDDHRAAIWLSIARARGAIGDVAGAQSAVGEVVRAAEHLEAADRADALAACARLRADLGDSSGAALLVADSASAAQGVTDPQDLVEVQMALATAQARCGEMDQARQSIAAARQAAATIPANKQHPGGDPPASEFLEVVQAAAAAGGFDAAQDIAAGVNDPRIKHDAALAVADAQIKLGQFRAAEDTAIKEGSSDSEAAVCGMIAASLARQRSPEETLRWVDRLNNLADKVAASLAVAEVQLDRPPLTPATAP